MVDVRGDDGAAAGHLGAYELRRAALALGDVLHLLGDHALAGVVKLGGGAVRATAGDPGLAHHEGSSPGGDRALSVPSPWAFALPPPA